GSQRVRVSTADGGLRLPPTRRARHISRYRVGRTFDIAVHCGPRSVASRGQCFGWGSGSDASGRCNGHLDGEAADSEFAIVLDSSSDAGRVGQESGVGIVDVSELEYGNI